MISAHLKEVELEFRIQEAWTDIRERIMSQAGGCHGRNEDYVLDEMTVTTLCLINLCLKKLIDDDVPGSRLYYRCTLKLLFCWMIVILSGKNWTSELPIMNIISTTRIS